jgi:hypothetical protein
MARWPKKFKSYYLRHVACDVLKNKKLLPSTYVTTNGIERYNRTIKDWCNHKEQDLDRMVLLLEWLQTFTLQQQTNSNIEVFNLTQLIQQYKNAMVKSSVFQNEWADYNFTVNQETVKQLNNKHKHATRKDHRLLPLVTRVGGKSGRKKPRRIDNKLF